MAKLPPLKKILREDVKDLPASIGVIIDTFNSLAESVYQALNRNITFRENVACFIKELTYKTSAAYPAGENVEFLNELKTKAMGVLLLQAVDRASYVAVDGPVYVPWVEDNGKIVIYPIKGLAASKTYSIRLLVI